MNGHLEMKGGEKSILDGDYVRSFSCYKAPRLSPALAGAVQPQSRNLIWDLERFKVAKQQITLRNDRPGPSIGTIFSLVDRFAVRCRYDGNLSIASVSQAAVDG